MIKKAASWALIAVLIIWLVNDPAGAAALAHNAAHALSRAATALTSIASSFGG